MKESYAAAVKWRMACQFPAKIRFGTYRGKRYPHILQNLDDNFIGGQRQKTKRLKGNLPNAEIRYHYAEHLNSSQTMCIAYFMKFFENSQYEAILLRILQAVGIDPAGGSIADAVLEHVPDAEERTNLDFFLRLDNGMHIMWEIKFTEAAFGGTGRESGNPTRYINAYSTIHSDRLRKCFYAEPERKACTDLACLKTGTLTHTCPNRAGCSVYDFYCHYQIRRNILYAKTKDDYVLFLTPRENESLNEGRAYIEAYAARHQTDRIRNLYWEDLLHATLREVSGEPKLLDYYTRFQKKYFGRRCAVCRRYPEE